MTQWCTIPAMSWFRFRFWFQAYSESLIPIPIPELLWKPDSDSDSRLTLKAWFRFRFRFQKKILDSTPIPIPAQIFWFLFQLKLRDFKQLFNRHLLDCLSVFSQPIPAPGMAWLTHTGPGQVLAGKLLTTECQMHAFNSNSAWAATGRQTVNNRTPNACI